MPRSTPRCATCAGLARRARSDRRSHVVLALDLPHTELVVPGLLFLIIGLGPDRDRALLARVVERRRHRGVAGEDAPHRDDAAAERHPGRRRGRRRGRTGRSARAFRARHHLAGADRSGAGPLTSDERCACSKGSGIAGDAWCAGILRHAYEEENDELRVAAVEALGACEGDDVRPTLERAYTSNAVAERYAAIDGASRRGDVALLERALHDSDGTVALAAAYGLQRAKRADLIERGLTGRTDRAPTKSAACCRCWREPAPSRGAASGQRFAGAAVLGSIRGSSCRSTPR